LASLYQTNKKFRKRTSFPVRIYQVSVFNVIMNKNLYTLKEAILEYQRYKNQGYISVKIIDTTTKE
jgi:hypothetical protein